MVRESALNARLRCGLINESRGGVAGGARTRRGEGKRLHFGVELETQPSRVYISVPRKSC